MEAINFKYDVDYKLNKEGLKTIVLTQLPFFKGTETTIEIPIDDIESVLKLINKAKEDVDHYDFDKLSKVKKNWLEENIVNTLVTLYLSGISTRILANQYSIDEEVVKVNLEEKGIILFD